MRLTSLLAIVACFLVAGCQNRQEKVAAAKGEVQEEKQDVAEATQELNQVQREARAEWQQDYLNFKREMNAEVAENERLILERRSEVANLAESARDQYDDLLDNVEKQNHELRDRVSNAMDEGDVAWEQFKTDVRQGFADVESSIKSIHVAHN